MLAPFRFALRAGGRRGFPWPLSVLSMLLALTSWASLVATEGLVRGGVDVEPLRLIELPASAEVDVREARGTDEGAL